MPPFGLKQNNCDNTNQPIYVLLRIQALLMSIVGELIMLLIKHANFEPMHAQVWLMPQYIYPLIELSWVTPNVPLCRSNGIQVSPDFFSYFANTYSLLALDKTLQCISSWNDQAQRGRALNNTALYRTDIFPGLGWMLDRERALEVLTQAYC